MADDNTIDTVGPVERLAPHDMSPLANVGPESLKNIALQSRPLTDNESASINDIFKGSIDPRDIRIAYDAGAKGTTLGGYVIGRDLPTVIFLPSDVHQRDLTHTELHEATHVWQNLTKWKYTGTGVPGHKQYSNMPEEYQYSQKDATARPFTDFSDEQQAEMMAFNENSAKAFIQAHKANRPFAGDMAFLDSVRSRYAQPNADPMKAAASKGAFSMVQREGGKIYMKAGNAVSPSTRGNGDHNVVLENLRTKFPSYRGIEDGKVLAALLHKHPSYVQHVGDSGLRLALETGHKPNGQ